MSHVILDLRQGSTEWLAHRANCFNASDAPAMMGASKYKTRAELLREKVTGVVPEVSPHQQALFDRGHAAEAATRPMVEDLIGEELFPVTAAIDVGGLPLSASYDGLTLTETKGFENKLWNEALADQVRRQDLEPHYYWQLEQQLLVVGAESIIFCCSDGTPERFVWMEYRPVPGRAEQLVDGWRQFKADMQAYTARPAAEPKPEGKAPDTLPALRIEISGTVTASNLAEFKDTALTAIRNVNRTLTTDTDFADAEKAVKWCSDVEDRLAAAKQHALSQMDQIDALFRTIDDISAEARRVRLELDKLVKARKEQLRGEIIAGAVSTYRDHLAALDAEIAPLRLILVAPDFGAPTKGKRTLASVQDAVDGALAQAKIAADKAAREVREKLTWYRGAAAEFAFLFADLQALVAKPLDDFQLAVTTRIQQHQAAEAEKERKRLEAEAAAQPAPAATPAAPPVLASGVTSIVRPVEPAPWDEEEPATLKLGDVCTRLGFTVKSAFLSQLGIEPARTEKAARFYTERQFFEICRRLVAHITAAANAAQRRKAA